MSRVIIEWLKESKGTWIRILDLLFLRLVLSAVESTETLRYFRVFISYVENVQGVWSYKEETKLFVL